MVYRTDLEMDPDKARLQAYEDERRAREAEMFPEQLGLIRDQRAMTRAHANAYNNMYGPGGTRGLSVNGMTPAAYANMVGNVIDAYTSQDPMGRRSINMEAALSSLDVFMALQRAMGDKSELGAEISPNERKQLVEAAKAASSTAAPGAGILGEALKGKKPTLAPAGSEAAPAAGAASGTPASEPIRYAPTPGELGQPTRLFDETQPFVPGLPGGGAPLGTGVNRMLDFVSPTAGYDPLGQDRRRQEEEATRRALTIDPAQMLTIDPRIQGMLLNSGRDTIRYR
jgi:hypothetical protein